MVDLFADVPEEMIENTLQTIRRNLDRVGLYGGHTLRKHTDIQLLAFKDQADERRYPLCNILLGRGSSKCGGKRDYASVFRFQHYRMAEMQRQRLDFADRAVSTDSRLWIPERRGETGREFKEGLPGACKGCGYRLGIPDSDQLSHV